MSIEDFLKNLFRLDNQVERIKFLRKNSSYINEELFWLLHFYTTIFLVKGKWTQSLELIELVMEVSDIVNNSDLSAQSKYLQVACYHFLSDFDRAEVILKERVNIYQVLMDLDNLSDALLQLGLLYISRNDLEKALESFSKAEGYLKKQEQWEELVYCSLNIGEIYFSSCNIDQALKYFNQAWEYSKKVDDSSLQCRPLNWIGYIYELQGNKEEAMNKFYMAMEKVKSRLNPNMIYSLANQGRSLKKMGYFKEAYFSYKQILELRREIDFKQALGKNLYYRGLVLMDTGLLEKACKCFYEALHIFREIGNWQTEICLLFSIGIIKWKSGENIDSISFFIEPLRDMNEGIKDDTFSISESFAFKPISLKYSNNDDTEFHLSPYIGKIEFREGAIFEYSEEKPDIKLFDLLEGFLGRKQKKDIFSYQTDVPLVDRDVLEEEIFELALLCFNMEDYSEALSLSQEILAIMLFYRNDKGTEQILDFINDIYIQTSYYERGIDFFSRLSCKAYERRMKRTEALCYLYQGELLARSRRFSESILIFQKSLALRREIGEKKSIIDMLIVIGKFHKEQGGYPLAEKYFQEALEECDKGDNKEEKLEILKLIAMLLTLQKRVDKAMNIYRQLVYETKDLENIEERLPIFLLAGNNCDFLGFPKISLEIYLLGLITAHNIESTEWLCIFLESTARIYEDLGLYLKAEACYNYKLNLAQSEMMLDQVAITFGYLSHQKFIKGDITWAESLVESSLELSREINNKIEIWKGLICSGRIKQELGKIEDSYSAFQEAYQIATEGFSVEAMEGASNFHLGAILCFKGQLHQALFYLREAYRIYINEINQENFYLYPRRKAHSYNYLTIICLILGRLDEAYDYSLKALNINSAMGLLPCMSGDFSYIGEVFHKWGRYEEAEDYFKKALDICKNTKDLMGRLRIVGELGRLYLDQGRYDDGKKCFEEILDDNKVIGLKRTRAIEIHNLGYSYYCLKDYDKALEKINSAILLFRELDYKMALLLAHQNLARVNLAMNNPNFAADNLFIAINLGRTHDFLSHNCTLLFELARIRIMEEDYDDAFQFLVQAREISQKIGRMDLLWKIIFEFGRIAIKQYRYRQGLEFYRQAINELEDYPDFTFLEFSEKYSDNSEIDDYSENKIYEALIDYFLQAGQNEDALEFVIRAKAFFRKKAFQKKRDVRFEYNDSIFDEESYLRMEMRNSFYRLVNQEEVETLLIQDLQEKFNNYRLNYRSLISEIIKKYPHLRQYFEVISLSVSDLKSKLPEGAFVVEYYFSEKNTILFCLNSFGGFYKLKLSALPMLDEHIRKNLVEELSKEEFQQLFKYIYDKFPEIDEHSKVYYIFCDELVLIS